MLFGTVIVMNRAMQIIIPTRTCPKVVVMCSSNRTSPLVLKVGNMLGPMH